MKAITILVFTLLISLAVLFMLLEFYFLSMLFSGMGILQVFYLEFNK